MKHLPSVVFFVVIPIMVMTPVIGTAAWGQDENPRPQQTTGCTDITDIRSVDCQQKAASIVQDSFSANFPNAHVRAFGYVLVFADPELLKRQEDRTSYLSVIRTSGLEAQLCRFGFKTLRIESSANATLEAVPGQEYHLRCLENQAPPRRLRAGAGAREKRIETARRQASEQNEQVDLLAKVAGNNSRDHKSYSSGTLLAMAEGNAGWIGIGGMARKSLGGVLLPTFSRYAYAVKIGDIMYLGRCTNLLHMNRTLRDFIIGDPVRTRIEGNHLYIVALNGKEIELDVIERQRAP
jgi:hypothetical protein